MRSGLISVEQLSEVELFERYRREALAEYPQLEGRRVLYETIRRMLSAQVYDVIDATRAAIETLAPADADAVRMAPPLVAFSETMQAQSEALKRFLFRNLYRHPQARRPPTRRSKSCASCSTRTSSAAAKCPPRTPSAATGPAPWPTTSPA